MRSPLILLPGALSQAIESRRPVGSRLLHHSDRGCQYTSEAYRGLLDSMGIECSMSRPGSCHDKTRADRFFWSLEAKMDQSHHPCPLSNKPRGVSSSPSSPFPTRSESTRRSDTVRSICLKPNTPRLLRYEASPQAGGRGPSQVADHAHTLVMKARTWLGRTKAWGRWQAGAMVSGQVAATSHSGGGGE
ncbi:MAG: hypothetical protein DWH79_01870 [Planctomycetota bacterium]|nr:MAG: hypothetical protein DWH79_01870 [Planctomycetota bacterium]